MTKCKNCGILADGSLRHCPLCRRKFDGQTDNRDNDWYPKYELAEQDLAPQKVKRDIIKATLFTAFVLCCGLSLANGFFITDSLWCVYLIIPIVYLAFTITHTIFSRAHLGLKILFQVVAVSGLLLAVDIRMGFTRWSVNYAFPFLLIGGNFLMIVIMSAKRAHLRGFIEFIIALMLFSLLPIHLYIYGASTVFWPAILAEINAVFTLVGLFIFSHNDFLSEVKRRFHF